MPLSGAETHEEDRIRATPAPADANDGAGRYRHPPRRGGQASQQRRGVPLPPGQRFPVPHRFRRARGGRGAGSGAAAGRVRAVRARPRSDPGNLGRRPRRPGGRGRAVRCGRRLSDRRHRRHPARTDGAVLAGVLHHGCEPRVRPACAGVGEYPAVPGQARPAHAPGVRGARSPAARHAAVQEPCRAGRNASRGDHRGRGALPGDAPGRAGSHGVRGHGRAAARVSPQQGRHFLSPDRWQRRRTLASFTITPTTARCATATCC